MTSKMLDIINEVIQKKIDKKVLVELSNLYEYLSFCHTIEEMSEKIYEFLFNKYYIDAFNFVLFDMEKGTNQIINQKGGSFYPDDNQSFLFVIETKTEVNAVISFLILNNKEYLNVLKNYKYIEALFSQISSVLQNGILKKMHIESNSIDSVTHVYNRKQLLTDINKILILSGEKKAEITFLMIGIDRFKAVIDEFNHDIGDEVLVELAKVIYSNIKEKDIVGRVTGDEFLVALLHITDYDAIVKIVEQLIIKFTKSEIIVNKETNQVLRKTICIGISKYPEDGTDVGTVIKNADRSLSEAKNKGRSNYSFYNKEELETIDFF